MKAESRRYQACALAVAVLLVAGRVEHPRVTSAQAPSSAMAIVGATLIDGTGDPARPNTTIVIAGDRLARIGPAASTPVPQGARVIQAAGKYIIPGLWDAHVHFRDYQIEPLITHGITSAIDWTTTDEFEWVQAQKEGVAKGRIYGPRLFISGEMIRENQTAEQARQQVRALKARGVDKIDAGLGLKKDTLLAAIDEAQKLGLPTSGYPIYARAAIDAGISALKHTYPLGAANVPEKDLEPWVERQLGKRAIPDRDAREYLLGDDYHELAKLMAAKKVTWVATFAKDFKMMLDRRDEYELENYRFLANPELQYLPLRDFLVQMTNDHETGIPLVVSGRIGTTDRKSADWQRFARTYKNLLGFTKAFVDAGGHVAAGTAPHSFVLPGLGLHQELQLFVDAGLTPMQALQSATLWPAQYIRADKDLGSVVEGKLADIVILQENPLANIRNARTVETVIQGGRVLRTGYHSNYANPIPRVTRVGAGTTVAAGPPGEGNVAPQVSAIAPDAAAEGSPDTTITVRGRGFIPASSVFFERVPVETTFVSPTELKAVVPARVLGTVGTYLVNVSTPEPGGGQSDRVPFFVKYR